MFSEDEAVRQRNLKPLGRSVIAGAIAHQTIRYSGEVKNWLVLGTEYLITHYLRNL